MHSVAEYIIDLIQNMKNIISGDWLVCTILCLEDHSSGFMADKAVPAARFDGHAAVGVPAVMASCSVCCHCHRRNIGWHSPEESPLSLSSCDGDESAALSPAQAH